MMRPNNRIMEIEYLDINSCTAEELQAFTGIPPAQAQQIIEYRNSKGAFYHLSEMLEVPGLGSDTFLHISGCEPGKLDGYLIRHNIKRLVKKNEGSAFTMKDITALVSKIPTLCGAILCSEDGLILSSEVKMGVPADKIAAAVSMCFKQFSETLQNFDASNLKMVTVDIENYTITVFHQKKLYLLVIHKPNQFSTRVCNLCSDILQEVNRVTDTQKISLPKT